MTLNSLLEMGLQKYLSIIESVSATAAAEYKLEKELNDMEESWKLLEFSTMPHKETGTFVLRAVDEII